MGIDRRGGDRRKARAGTSAWLCRLCLGACAIVGPPALQAQTVPANRPTALELLQAVVGLEPSGIRPVAQPDRPGAIRLILPPSLPQAPVPLAASQGPARLDRVERLVDVLADLNRAIPPGSPPLLPVEALIPEREIVPAVLEMPIPKPAPAEVVPAPVSRVAAGAVAPSSGSWEMVRVVLCLGLIGTFFLVAVFLVARWVGLTIRLRVSLGSPGPRA